jgi:hypothetical protein
MPLALFADDDALYSTGANGPMNNPAPPVNVTISKYRGPGKVTVADARPKFEAIKGGKAMEPYTGKSATAVTFSEPGEYLLHVTANDYSGNGGGGSVCCWTNALLKVTVTGGTVARRNGLKPSSQSSAMRQPTRDFSNHGCDSEPAWRLEREAS